MITNHNIAASGHSNSGDSQNQRIIKASDIGTIFLDLGLKITTYTPSVTGIFNLNTDFHGLFIGDIAAQLGYIDLVSDIETVLEQLNEIEKEIKLQDGSIYLFRLTPYRTDKDPIRGIVITFINITESRRAEERLQKAESLQREKESRELLRSVIDSSLDIIQVLKSVRNDKGTIIDFKWIMQNQKAFQQNGDVIGASLLEKNPGVVDAGIFEKLKQVTDTGVPQELEQYYSSEQFSEKWFYLAMVKQDDGVVMTTRDITEQVKAKKEIFVLKDELAQNVTDKYLGLFNAIDEGFCIIEVLFDKEEKPYDWRFLEVNPAFEKNNGLFNATGKTMVEMAPDIEPKWFEIYGTVAKTQKPLRFKEHSVALKRHFDLYAFPVDKPGDNHVAVIFTDITQRIISEDALRNSEERLRVTMESALDYVIITMDTQGNIQHWNTGAKHTFGYSLEEVTGKSFGLIFTAADRQDNIPEKELRMAREKGYADDERWHLRKDGTRFFMSGMTRPIYNPELTGYVKVARDMTQNQQAAEQLRLLEERHRIALGSGGMAAWDWNIKEGKMTWSENHYTLLGLAVPDSLDAKAPDFMQFVHPDDKSVITAAMEQAMRTGDVYQAEYRIIRADNEKVVWGKSYGSVVSYEKGKAARMVGVMLDITEHKSLTEELSRLVAERTNELQRSNDDLRQFAHVASHDLKEPVRKIRTFNNRLLDEFEDSLPPQAKTFIERIESSCARMYSMIEGVLHYSKLEGANAPLEDVDLNAIISHISTDLEVLIEAKNACILTAELPLIKANNSLIYQLFYNLILNALKFSRSVVPAEIKIYASRVNVNCVEYFKIELKDNGIGFDSKYSSTIFNTFTRLNSADLYEGSGLGLALCKKIVERYKGSISAEGLPGEGATFTILLPTNNF
ncbi:MAG: hypothetical protein DI539_05175 [Flavobacterium psychrophilum]|nr:MAG: hypothetical protein DI539_05175 [Flavobacterium psychrophilum]